MCNYHLEILKEIFNLIISICKIHNTKLDIQTLTFDLIDLINNNDKKLICINYITTHSKMVTTTSYNKYTYKYKYYKSGHLT